MIIHERIALIYTSHSCHITLEMVALIHQRKYDLVKMKIVKHAGLELILRWCAMVKSGPILSFMKINKKESSFVGVRS